MGAIVPQVVTEDRAGGALIVDGGLRFDRSKTNIVRKTFSSAGNRKTWTLSFWHKVTDTSNAYNIFTASRGSSTRPTFEIAHNYGSSGNLVLSQYNGSGYDIGVKVDGLYRDTNAWYHFVIVVDTTQSTDSNRVKVYVNGTQRTVTATAGGSVWPSLNADLEINNGVLHNISANAFGDGNPMNGYVCLMYMVDGQALDASYFGYTDALTNVWRPKKLSSSISFGTNGFYLPFDGSAPIGQDQSGRGNNWTPVNFGGSTSLEKATGALPILNTDGGGKVARVGVRTDANASSLVLALPLVGIKSDFSNQINGGTTEKAVTSVNAVASSAQSNFYGGSFYFDGTGDYVITGSESDFGFGTGDFTLECWVYCTRTGDYQGVLSNRPDSTSGTSININNTNLVEFQVATNTATSPNVMPTNRWVHLALTRSGTTCRGFIDGVNVATFTSSGNDGSSNIYNMGRYYYNSDRYYFQGYIQDARIYKGVAKYTSNFIPASTDPDIVPDSPSGVSYSSNLIPVTDGAVAFDGSGDYLSIANSTDFEIGSGDYTLELFVYGNSWLSSNGGSGILGKGNVTSLSGEVYTIQINNGTVQYYVFNSTTNYNNPLISSTSTLSTGSWHHIAISRSGNNTRLFVNGILQSTSTENYTVTTGGQVYIGTQAYDPGNSTRSHTGFISNLHIVKGTALYTSNFTPPSAPLTATENTKLLCCQSNTSANVVNISPATYSNDERTWSSNLTTNTGGFEASYPQANAFDGNITTTANTNSTTGNPTLTFTPSSPITGITKLRVWTDNIGDNAYATGTISVNGGSETSYTTLGVPSFTGQWIDITSLVSEGTLTNFRILQTNKGSYTLSLRIYAIEINDTVLINNFNGEAIARAGNTSATNFNPFTVNINTQRGKQSGYATWNPLKPPGGTTTFANGNLDTTFAFNGSTFPVPMGNVGVYTGRWYWEITPISGASGSGGMGVGIGNQDCAPTGAGAMGVTANAWGYYYSGNKYNNNSSSSYGSSYTNGDIIGVALDANIGSLSFYKNGIYQGVAYSGLSNTNTYFPAVGNSGDTTTVTANFGQKPFKFPPPPGFQPLTLANLPRPTIVRPDQYVGIVTYTGNGATQTVNVGLKPDFIWIKSRSNAYDHQLVDVVRGLGNPLYSNLTNSESTLDTVTATTLNGFTVNGSTYAGTNGNGATFVAWAWKAGGNSNTFNIDDVGYGTASAAGLTSGTITPTGASVNTKSGFSIITYAGNGTSGATVSHGLERTPSLLIVKRRSSAGTTPNWAVWHSSLSAGNNLFLNTTDDAQAFSPSRFTSTIPTSSVFSLGGGDETNYNTGTFVAYSWAEIPGFSKFGSYSGNGSADGPVIITGFRPRWIMIKRTSTAGGSWIIWDSVRDTYNYFQYKLAANLSSAENDAATIGYTYQETLDNLSNGFKLRSTNQFTNTSGVTYIYAAFAEAPTFNLYGAQANAR